jgi:hypothetical protein
MFHLNMPLQEMFDKAYNHLWEQNRPARYPVNSHCYYRGPDNTKCAIGCLIPDEEYSDKFEDKSVVGLAQENLITIEGYISPSPPKDGVYGLAHRLQKAHDTIYYDDVGLYYTYTFNSEIYNKGSWRKCLNIKFSEIAKDFNLAFTSKEE